MENWANGPRIRLRIFWKISMINTIPDKAALYYDEPRLYNKKQPGLPIQI